MPFFKMSPLVLKNAASGPATRRYPEQVRGDLPRTRGRIELRLESCTFCGLCQKRCPTGAIALDRQERVFTLDRFKCILCGACQDACFAQKCLFLAPHYAAPTRTRQVETWKQAAPPPPRAGLAGREPGRNPGPPSEGAN